MLLSIVIGLAFLGGAMVVGLMVAQAVIEHLERNNNV